jgi:hypothetical protein
MPFLLVWLNWGFKSHLADIFFQAQKSGEKSMTEEVFLPENWPNGV